jgi:t-SNARE complex subunit (syntaxin)
MGIQERNYYQDPYLKKDKKTDFSKIFIWIIIVIMIFSLVASLIPTIR